MITAWIIGLLLSFLGIWFLKNSRIKANKKTWDKPARPERPVLRAWSLALLVIGGLVPILNIILALCIIVWWIVSIYGDKDWVFTKGDTNLRKTTTNFSVGLDMHLTLRTFQN